MRSEASVSELGTVAPSIGIVRRDNNVAIQEDTSAGMVVVLV